MRTWQVKMDDSLYYWYHLNYDWYACKCLTAFGFLEWYGLWISLLPGSCIWLLEDAEWLDVIILSCTLAVIKTYKYLLSARLRPIFVKRNEVDKQIEISKILIYNNVLEFLLTQYLRVLNTSVVTNIIKFTSLLVYNRKHQKSLEKTWFPL